MNKNILKNLAEETTTVTSFNLHPRAINAIKWITGTHHITKQRLFEVIIQDDSKIIDYYKINNDGRATIPLKIRITKNNLSLLNKKFQKGNLNRDQYVSNALIKIYNNMSSQMNEDKNATNKALSEIEQLKKSVMKSIDSILVNEHLKRSFHSKYDTIMEICNYIEKKMKDDVDNLENKENKK